MTTTVTIYTHNHGALIIQKPHMEGKPNVITGEPFEIEVAPNKTFLTCVHSTGKLEIVELDEARSAELAARTASVE